MITALACFGLSLLLTLFLVPVAKRVALWLGIVDAPDKHRKLHGRIVPLTGGLILGTVLPLVLIAAAAVDSDLLPQIRQDGLAILGIVVSCGLLLFVGLTDDRVGVRGRQKLLAQLVCGVILLGSFYAIKPTDLFPGWLPIGFSFAFLLIWIVGSVNAVNLIDGADGLASTVGTIAALGIFAMTFDGQANWENLLAISLAGTLIGFLAYNFPPASTFLGDGGSMLIGLLVGALAIHSSVKQAASVALCAPVAIVAVPFFDSFVAILRRRLTGRSIYTVDRGHLHHTLLNRGLGPRRMLAVVAGLSTIAALGGVLSLKLHTPWFSLLSVGMVVSILVFGRIFGHAEFGLLSHRFVRLGRSFLVRPRQGRSDVHEQQFRLQGSRNWDYLWEALTEFAERHRLQEVRLDLNLPWLHEGYHAVWQRRVTEDEKNGWQTKLPLYAEGRVFGHLQLSGPANQASVYSMLGLLAEMLESMESVIVRLASNPASLQDTAIEATEELEADQPTGEIAEDLLGVADSGEHDLAPVTADARKR
ncbi:MAG TPA: undecaprenyl/decaprenyl-phosphate alpha-N-acetylglucosaminyl 1-phosphate transferase [Planctomycetaceae bacterium]|nr:undecaprenyl/decaprenyl-phosphate alpha-N-acetylglucosaminyl 1-phosphate transferase [Planctomycetaceae bacterium]HRE99405.1 undecaprenyl/decaprenyl-phosphate alpha-N-acetylglucosaminyl 1-phosphate transferase [Pirellulaceae bacterium]